MSNARTARAEISIASISSSSGRRSGEKIPFFEFCQPPERATREEESLGSKIKICTSSFFSPPLNFQFTIFFSPRHTGQKKRFFSQSLELFRQIRINFGFSYHTRFSSGEGKLFFFPFFSPSIFYLFAFTSPYKLIIDVFSPCSQQVSLLQMRRGVEGK